MRGTKLIFADIAIIFQIMSLMIFANTKAFPAGSKSGSLFKSATGSGNENLLNFDTYDSSETVYMNFIKVLAGVLIRSPEAPIPILDSIKVVMKETMNTQSENENFVHFLLTGMIGLEDSPLPVQVDKMLSFMASLTKEPQLSMAAKILQSYLKSSEAPNVYADIENYVTNLFQSVVTTPMIDSFGESVSTLVRARPANSHINLNRDSDEDNAVNSNPRQRLSSKLLT